MISRIMRSFWRGSLSAISSAKATIALSARRCAPSRREEPVAGEVLEEQQRPDALVAVGERVVLDDEVEQMRGAHLNRWVERPPVEGLLDGAEDAGKLVAALLAEQAAGLPSSASAARRSAMSAGRPESETEAAVSGRGGRFRQPVLVVLEEQAPGARVVLHDVEDSAALVGDQRVPRERAGEQADGLLDLAEAPLAQPSLVERVAAQEMLAQGPGRPDAELRAAQRVDAVADRDDGVEAVESGQAACRKKQYVHFLHIAFRRQLVVGQRPVNVARSPMRSRPNSSAICLCVSQIDSCSRRTSRRTSPSGDS